MKAVLKTSGIYKASADPAARGALFVKNTKIYCESFQTGLCSSDRRLCSGFLFCDLE
jgi:hypothetical protein